MLHPLPFYFFPCLLLSFISNCLPSCSLNLFGPRVLLYDSLLGSLQQFYIKSNLLSLYWTYFNSSSETLADSMYNFGISYEISLESTTFLKNPLPSMYLRVFSLISLRYCLAMTLENTLLWVLTLFSFSFLNSCKTLSWITKNKHFIVQVCLPSRTYPWFFCFPTSHKASTLAVGCSLSSVLLPAAPPFCLSRGSFRRAHSKGARPHSQSQTTHYPKSVFLFLSK